jgi:hypothetical protein
LKLGEVEEEVDHGQEAVQEIKVVVEVEEEEHIPDL